VGSEIRTQRACRRRSTHTLSFADLVGDTALTKAMGDGVMIWIGDAIDAVSLAAETLERVGTRSDLLPVRIGAHTGLAVRRGSDWYGTAVNLGARLADQAETDEPS
jgi:adenylate cyclase